MSTFEVLGFLAEVGKLYRTRCLEPLWSSHQEHEQDPWDSLGLFLEGYAFERQGRRPDFCHASGDMIAEVKPNGLKLGEATVPQFVWHGFCNKLGDCRLNPALNPVCPKGTAYKFGGRERVTCQPSAVEVAVTAGCAYLASIPDAPCKDAVGLPMEMVFGVLNAD